MAAVSMQCLPEISYMKPENQGMLYGLLGVAAFSLTLPMTRLAVADLSPVTVGLGRCC
jgi:hypothetical protein